MSFLTSLLGSDPLGTVKDIADEFIDTKAEKADREIRMQEALADIEIKLEDAFNKKLALEVEDRTRASNMQIEALKQDDLFSKRFLYWFSIGWSIFAIAYFVAITFIQLPEKNVRFADSILGFMLGTIVASIIAFWFGSSIGSRDKDK